MSDSTPKTVVGRREFVRACAATAAVGVVSTTSSAEHARSKPEHVSLSYETDLLEKYQPSLVTVDLKKYDPQTAHAFVARSTEYETTALVYFHQYEGQDGFTVYDSHEGDREPFYVFLSDEGTADESVDSVSYSAYHWFRGYASNPPLSERSGTNPKAYVFYPHHHHSVEHEKATEYVGEYPELRDLRDTYPAWLRNGLHAEIAEGVVYEPWRMEGATGRGDWWDHSGLSGVERTLRSAYLRAGLGSADRSDLK